MITFNPNTVRVTVASLQAVNRQEPPSAKQLAGWPQLDLRTLPDAQPLRGFPQLKAVARLAAEFSDHIESTKNGVLHSQPFQTLSRDLKPHAHFFPWWIRQPIGRLFSETSPVQ